MSPSGVSVGKRVCVCVSRYTSMSGRTLIRGACVVVLVFVLVCVLADVRVNVYECGRVCMSVRSRFGAN